MKQIWKFITAVGFALSWIFVPRDYPEAGVKIGRLDS